ncbi:hypothetical protein Tco_0000293 [Tanacetum coccineum]
MKKPSCLLQTANLWKPKDCDRVEKGGDGRITEDGVREVLYVQEIVVPGGYGFEDLGWILFQVKNAAAKLEIPVRRYALSFLDTPLMSLPLNGLTSTGRTLDLNYYYGHSYVPESDSQEDDIEKEWA